VLRRWIIWWSLAVVVGAKAVVWVVAEEQVVLELELHLLLFPELLMLLLLGQVLQAVLLVQLRHLVHFLLLVPYCHRVVVAAVTTIMEM
jgi:hypothetical protein